MHRVALAMVVQSPLERADRVHARAGETPLAAYRNHGYRKWQADAAFTLITRAVGTIGHFWGGS